MARHLISKEQAITARAEIRAALKDGTTVTAFLNGLDERALAVLRHLAEKELRSRNSRLRTPGNRRPDVEE